VLQHGGTIDVESKSGDGTAFRIQILTVAAPQRDYATASSSNVNTIGTGRTVLVVDDKPEVLTLVATVLERAGYKVLSADTPSIALSMIKQEANIDLALCDLVMPEMHGTVLASKMKQIRPSLSIVYMSGYGGDVVKLPPHSMLLKKPFSLDELRRFVANALEEQV
jgi:DNA-binding NtrC family response regulator